MKDYPKSLDVLCDMLLETNKPNNHKASYVGDCTSLFDEDTGECSCGIFRDVSDFANREETAREEMEEGRDLLMSFEEFSSVVDISVLDGKNTQNFEYYFYEETEFEKQVYVAYDMDEDIHYFFVE